MTIILSNEASLVDFCFLKKMFAPCFITVDLIDAGSDSAKDDRMGLRVLGKWELI